jgi:hypothetical protein
MSVDPSASPVVDPNAALGRWHFDRRVVDNLAAATGCAHGELLVTPAEGTALDWHETGQLTWGGRTVPVTRSLRVERLDDEWWMTFADGRPFHPWRPGEWVVHPCAEDTYTGRVEINGDRIRTEWRVTGPVKDQLLVTRLRRIH